MSTAAPTTTRTGHAGTARPSWRGRSRLTFGGVLRSEWIKLSSLRSTWWSLGTVVVLAITASFMIANTSTPQSGSSAEMIHTSVMVGNFSIFITSLIAASLGVIVASGEYSTGMIRSTLTAVPRRLPTLWAKAGVLFACLFVTGLITSFGGFLLTQGILSGKGLGAALTDDGALVALISGGVFLGLIGMMAFGLGSITRSGAGGIVISVGIIMVLPTIVLLLGTQNWEPARVLMSYLPSEAGKVMYSTPQEGIVTMEYWQALLVVLGWVVVTLVPAAILLKRRDA
ncbi:ABC transporter permease [Klugiella xanthotipulae]|uniref:ABC-2 type transport system permease protein n=1 Tax=Klugiella xanthotipulae TaxID=244735 RepID=A0A543I5T0_9MICO|nr:ABC transporter permease subunit [Klugiella xanthotipulae]TQM65938.1 ABC-2 type transport system permease protein [Klugiella xanthotipulae]